MADMTTFILELMEDNWNNIEDDEEVKAIQKKALESWFSLRDLVVETLDSYREHSPIPDPIYYIIRRELLFDDNMRHIREFVQGCYDDWGQASS